VEALDRSDPALRAQLYEELGINDVYDPNRHTVQVQVGLGSVLVVSEGGLEPGTRPFCRLRSER
jgi:hypothetical protein